MKPEKLEWTYWSVELAVGHPPVDADHQRILTLIARLRHAVTEGEDPRAVTEGIAQIAAYSEGHFQREERLLEAVGYAHLAAHRLRHDSFRAYVAHALSEPSAIDQGELLSYLVDWWVGHIASEDKLYRPSLLGKDVLIADTFDTGIIRQGAV